MITHPEGQDVPVVICDYCEWAIARPTVNAREILATLSDTIGFPRPGGQDIRRQYHTSCSEVIWGRVQALLEIASPPEDTALD